MSEVFPTHLIGSPSLLTTLINHVRQAARHSLPPVDPVVIQALLTCIIAGESHLIIRAPEEDVGIVARLVVWTLTSVFDYTTHKLKIRHKSSPAGVPAPVNRDYFLKSLFLPTSFSSSGSTYTSQDESSDANKSRRLDPRRSRTLKRPHTLPDGVSASPSHLHVDSAAASNTPTKSPTGHHIRSAATIATPNAYSETGHHHHSHYSNLSHMGNKPLPQLPRALVISGLENATVSSQRALAQVLSEKQVSFDTPRDGRRHRDGRGHPHLDELQGTWNLPHGFIVVYVCPIDPRERPNIHKSLLDKFAMSCNVSLKPAVRHALQSIPFSPSVGRTNSGSHSTPSSPLGNPMSLPSTHSAPQYNTRGLSQYRQSYHAPQPSLHSRSYSHSSSHLPTLSSPALPPSLIQVLHEACNQTRLSPILSLYLADLFSATRHHAQVDGTLLTARCVQDAERLARAARVVGADPTGVELLRGEEEDRHDPDSDKESESEDEDWQDIEDEYETIAITGSLRKSIGSTKGPEDPVDTQRNQPSQVPVLDVTEVNIGRMFPRCVSHRLRVRDGPREEVLAGAVFGATFGDSTLEDGARDETGKAYVDAYEVRPTVKDILVSVMSEV